ncbi:MAG: aquaporin [Acidobacteriota bacterium]|nr:aquaporin [Acidobacteriota bacterium]
MVKFAQSIAAELIGTFAVIFIAAGAICADQYLAASGQERLGILGIALAYGLAYAVMVSALGHISGGHFNPALTVGLWVTRRVGTPHAIGYTIAQLLGGIAAAYVLIALIPDGGWRTRALGSITPDLSPDITRGQGIALEAVLTFLFVFVAFAMLIDVRGWVRRFSGLLSGLTLSTGVLASAPFTGGSMNPARTLGPAVATHHWENHGVYWIGPLLGGVVASVIYDRVFLRNRPSEVRFAPQRPEHSESDELAGTKH